MTPGPHYQFSRHARNRMRRVRLTEAEVIAALAKPDEVRPSYKDRQNAWKRRGGQWLRVTHVIEKATTVVVTVTLTPRGPERRQG